MTSRQSSREEDEEKKDGVSNCSYFVWSLSVIQYAIIYVELADSGACWSGSIVHNFNYYSQLRIFEWFSGRENIRGWHDRGVPPISRFFYGSTNTATSCR